MDGEKQVQARVQQPEKPTSFPRRRKKWIALLLTAGTVGAAALAVDGSFRNIADGALSSVAHNTAVLARRDEAWTAAALRNLSDRVWSSMAHNPAIPTTRDEARKAAASDAEAPMAARHVGTDRRQDITLLPSNRIESASTPSDTVYPAPSLSTAVHPLSIGDKLKVVFYERVGTEEEKWGRTLSALRGIQQRPELSGDFTIQGDGTISVPLLGAVLAAGRSEQQVRAALAEAFEKTLGRKAIVDVTLQAYSPIYVLGPVKRSGSFPYVPGMTVLHALALAGGILRDGATVQPWQKVEAIRTIQKRNQAVESVQKLIARAVVLRAERDGTTPQAPLQLTELVGAAKADNLINEQVDRRKAIAMARKDREKVADAAVESAKQDLQIYTRMGSLDDLVKMRRKRLDDIRLLVTRKVLNETAMIQAQGELSDAEQRRQAAFNQYSLAKQRLATLEAEALRTRSDLADSLATEIEATERQIAENEHEIATSEDVLAALPATRTKFTSSNSKVLTYRLVRQTSRGPVEIKATGMSVLEPGDLVDVVAGASMSAEQQASKPQEPAQVKRPPKNAADQQNAGITHPRRAVDAGL